MWTWPYISFSRKYSIEFSKFYFQLPWHTCIMLRVGLLCSSDIIYDTVFGLYFSQESSFKWIGCQRRSVSSTESFVLSFGSHSWIHSRFVGTYSLHIQLSCSALNLYSKARHKDSWSFFAFCTAALLSNPTLLEELKENNIESNSVITSWKGLNMLCHYKRVLL